MFRPLPVLLAALFCVERPTSAQEKGPTRAEKVVNDRKKVEGEGYWIYNDLPKGFAEARRTGKPMIVALRCIPCEQCVKLDDDLLDTDKTVRPLLDRFVRVRVISTNGLDLSLFQFDTDQSFAIFLLNADGTIYSRYGTRSHRTAWEGDVSVAGLGKAMEKALAFHTDFAKSRDLFAAKRGPSPVFPVPESFPALKGKYGPQLDTKGDVVRSCIHCHQIGDAEREYHLKRLEPFPESVLFPYPHPKTLGLIIDPKECGTLKSVEADSIAALSGFRTGDTIAKLNGQPILSIADVQWVLHHSAGDGADLKADIVRDGAAKELSLKLPVGWKRRDDISWRASTWQLRRATLGGMKLSAADDSKEGEMRLTIDHVGQFAPHDVAKRAGFLKGDTLLSFDGLRRFPRETDLIAYVLDEDKGGSKVDVELLRGGKKMTLTLPIPATKEKKK
jgi:serine protease Do